MHLAMLLKAAASTTGTTAQSVRVATPPKIKTPTPALPTAAQIKAPSVSAGSAPKIPVIKPPTAAMPAITAGLNIELPSANEILAESLGVSTKTSHMQKEGFAPLLLLGLPALLGGGAFAARRLAQQGLMPRLVNMAQRGGWKSLPARLITGANPYMKQLMRMKNNAAIGPLVGVDDVGLLSKLKQLGLPSTAVTKIEAEMAMPGGSTSLSAFRHELANQAQQSAVRYGVAPGTARVTSLETAGLADEAARAAKNLGNTANMAAPGGIPWKWLLGGAGGMAALNGGLGNMLGLGGAPQQQQRPAPMMTMPMMYM